MPCHTLYMYMNHVVLMWYDWSVHMHSDRTIIRTVPISAIWVIDIIDPVLLLLLRYMYLSYMYIMHVGRPCTPGQLISRSVV
jgi:hypothetical protein